ncbi:unnamed protein product [Clonostachys chloroleuca]|uniref:Uncharacterized protein n=1 Tax=Clonostachys chloroleuca TaxID=1926264 RepID=A0AA35QD21_9HYPO|nr:unnamed protein product [Clonostachys chloroleuca]
MAEDSSQADTHSYSRRSQGREDEVRHISPSEAEWQVNSQSDPSNRSHAAADRSSRKGSSRTPRVRACTLVQDDLAWKSEITERVRQLENTVSTLLQENRRLELVRLSPQAPNTAALGLLSTVAVADSMRTTESGVGPTNPGASHRSSDRDDDESSLVPAPMNNLYDLAKASSTDRSAPTTYTDTASSSDDLISQGILSEAQARQLFDKYMNLQNQLLWGGVIFPYSTLESMREASVLLSTSILTVAVLHTPGQEETLQRCYNAFIALISNSSIVRNHNLHDVRGLCLGAFHLPNLSWRLKALRGVPLFTHTMVAFCATFLLKMASMWHRGEDIVSSTLSLGFNVREVFALVGRSADLLAEVGSDLSEKHVAKHIVAGIRRLLQQVETKASFDNHWELESQDVNYDGDPSYDSIAVDFAAQQVGVRANELIYNMDVDSLAALLEYGGGETFFTSLAQE